MSMYLCSKGHNSTEPDYCSECGVRIQGNSNPSFGSTGLPPSSLDHISCPDCSTPHEPDSGDFCEICGYNFVTGSHGELPLAVSHPLVAEPIKLEDQHSPSQQQDSLEPVSFLPLSPPCLTWELIISIDAVAHDSASPPPPINFTPVKLRLEKSTALIGRTSQARAVYPDIPLDHDDAVSHRHALLTLNPDGSLTLRDIGSSNGTRLNGVELTSMIDTPLNHGDEMTLGHWTRIKVMNQ